MISESDLIVNGVFQETDNPIMFVTQEEESSLRPGCLIIDVSCDEGMGFHFARPTTLTTRSLPSSSSFTSVMSVGHDLSKPQGMMQYRLR